MTMSGDAITTPPFSLSEIATKMRGEATKTASPSSDKILTAGIPLARSTSDSNGYSERFWLSLESTSKSYNRQLLDPRLKSPRRLPATNHS